MKLFSFFKKAEIPNNKKPAEDNKTVSNYIHCEEEKDLNRFLNPHKEYFDIALREIRQGKKGNHWMWFIFPQIQGLGHSQVSKFYGIKDLDEAYSFYTEYPTGEHLIMLCEELLKLPETNADIIFGYTDAMKLRSSMTLFSLLPDANPVFQKNLDKFYNGEKDQRTIDIINNQ